VTQYVQVVKLKRAGAFRDAGQEDEQNRACFSIFRRIPREKELAPETSRGRAANDAWKHPPAANKIDSAKLADIVAYIKYAVTGSKKTVDPSEVQ